MEAPTHPDSYQETDSGVGYGSQNNPIVTNRRQKSDSKEHAKSTDSNPDTKGNEQYEDTFRTQAGRDVQRPNRLTC